MKEKTDKWLMITLAASVSIMGIGYFMWTILIPIQDFGTMTTLEVRNAQKELALNYPLGAFLMNVGFVVFTLALLALVIRKILKVLKNT